MLTRSRRAAVIAAAIVLVIGVALAFLVSGAVGVFFGWYPARKASRLDPIEALHWE